MSDLIDDLIEAARLLGATQAKKGIGCYTREDARFERAMHESISDKAKRLTAERDKAQRKYERQREATVNTYARVRRLIEALRVTGQHSNRWKLKYKSQVPSLKRTIRDLCAERDELRRQLDPMGEYASADELIAALRAEKEEDEAMKQDARRYRDWLRGGANIPPESTRWPRWEVRHWDGRHWCTLFAEQMDAAIDAAMGLTRPAKES